MEELSSEQVEAQLEILEKKMARLRVLYEQFFQGIERVPPHQVQKDVVRILHDLQHQKIRQTTLKFRLQGVSQRFSAMKSYWARTTREIEEGRYKRQIGRPRARETEESGELTVQDLAAIRAVREQFGEEAAEAAERKRREDRMAAAAQQRAAESDEAAAFLQSMGVAAPASVGPADRGVARTATSRRVEAAQAQEQIAAASAAAAAASTGDDPPVRGMSADAIRAAAERNAAGSEALDERMQRLREMRERLRAGQGAGAAPTASAPPSPARPAAPAAAASRAAAPEDRARVVYERLVKTKTQLNENTQGLSYDAVRRSLEKQAEQVRQKRGCRDVDFDVVVRDGKAFLKAIPVD